MLDLSKYQFKGVKAEPLKDLRTMSAEDKEQLLMAGVDVESSSRSASFLHVDHAPAYCNACEDGVEVMNITEALQKYDGLPEYFWKVLDPNQDEVTKSVHDNLHGGYFIRARAGAKIKTPVQSCLFIKHDAVGQNIHNVVVVEEDAELTIISGCAVAHGIREAAHLGLSEFYIKKGGRLTFTMIHNWTEGLAVRPRTAGIVEEDGVYVSNYILLKPVKDLQMYPTMRLVGRGAVARFNSVIVVPEGSLADTGSRIILEAPDTRGESIARTLAVGGKSINRGHIIGKSAPSRGHLECVGLILDDGIIEAIPQIDAHLPGTELSHEAAIGKIDKTEIEYLMARGMDEEEATSTIVRGFLNVDIMGLPDKLRQVMDATIAEIQTSRGM